MRVRRAILPLLCFLVLCATVLPAPASDLQRPKLKISGYGFLGNRQLTRLLRNLQPSEGKLEFYDANFIEDSALLLISNLQRDGYLKPGITARVTLDNGDTESFEWSDAGLEGSFRFLLRTWRIIDHWAGAASSGSSSPPATR